MTPLGGRVCSIVQLEIFSLRSPIRVCEEFFLPCLISLCYTEAVKYGEIHIEILLSAVFIASIWMPNVRHLLPQKRHSNRLLILLPFSGLSGLILLLYLKKQFYFHILLYVKSHLIITLRDYDLLSRVRTYGPKEIAHINISKQINEEESKVLHSHR